MRDLIRLSTLVVCLPLLAAACGGEEEVPQQPGPTIGLMELPISLRNADPAPNNAVRIEISPDAMGVDGNHLIGLEGSKVPAGERADGQITKLRQALQQGGARRAAQIRLHVNTHYETTALVLNTLKNANINTVGFEVRKPGAGAETGWLVVENIRVEPADGEPETFGGAGQRRWDELVQSWQEVYEACRRDHYVDCAYKPVNPAQGGQMEISMFARGSALKVELTRFGMEEEDAAAQPRAQMIEGVPVPQPGAGEEDLGPPVTYAAFTWRFRAATEEGLSPISGAFRPLCGSNPCGVVITGDRDTMTMRLVSFLGAAFPNGTEAPQTLWEIPG